MAALDSIERSLEGIFVKSAPKLPAKGKEMLAEWVPWINLILGIFTLASLYWLWDWSRTVNYANEIIRAFGGGDVVSDRLTAGVWLGLVVLAIEAVLYIVAFSPLRARKKAGWNLLFYALIVNLIYGIVVMFTSYGGVGSFIGYLVGTIIGLYFLFQIREKYVGGRAAPVEPSA